MMLMAGAAFTAEASPTTVSGNGSTAVAGGNCNATTGSTTVTPRNGSGSYTYSWAYLSGSSATINTPTAASTTFTRNAAAGPSSGDPIRNYSGTFRCTVTDTVSGQTATADVTVNTTHTYTGP